MARRRRLPKPGWQGVPKRRLGVLPVTQSGLYPRLPHRGRRAPAPLLGNLQGIETGRPIWKQRIENWSRFTGFEQRSRTRPRGGWFLNMGGNAHKGRPRARVGTQITQKILLENRPNGTGLSWSTRRGTGTVNRILKGEGRCVLLFKPFVDAGRSPRFAGSALFVMGERRPRPSWADGHGR